MVARSAWATASNAPGPVQYWIAALNDGVVRTSPLPPDMWGNWTKANPASAWIEYRCPGPSRSTQAASASSPTIPPARPKALRPPAAWHLEYWDGRWRRIAGTYPTVSTGSKR